MYTDGLTLDSSLRIVSLYIDRHDLSLRIGKLHDVTHQSFILQALWLCGRLMYVIHAHLLIPGGWVDVICAPGCVG
jgi:hypothetical protein